MMTTIAVRYFQLEKNLEKNQVLTVLMTCAIPVHDYFTRLLSICSLLSSLFYGDQPLSSNNSMKFSSLERRKMIIFCSFRSANMEKFFNWKKKCRFSLEISKYRNIGKYPTLIRSTWKKKGFVPPLIYVIYGHARWTGTLNCAHGYFDM